MFVSAKYATPDPTDPTVDPHAAIKPVLATDEKGTVWSLMEDSQLGDWLRYKEEGGTIAPADQPATSEAPSEDDPMPETEFDGFQPNKDDVSTVV